MLGSKERYAKLFAETRGTYYYSPGWLEFSARGGARVDYMPNSWTGRNGKPSRKLRREIRQGQRPVHLRHHGGVGNTPITHGTYISFPFTDHLNFAERVRAICADRGWEYGEVRGDVKLIQDWLDGKWDDDRFLTVQPGQAIGARYDESVMACRDCPACPERVNSSGSLPHEGISSGSHVVCPYCGNAARRCVLLRTTSWATRRRWRQF